MICLLMSRWRVRIELPSSATLLNCYVVQLLKTLQEFSSLLLTKTKVRSAIIMAAARVSCR